MCKCVRVTNTALYTYCGIQQATTSKCGIQQQVNVGEVISARLWATMLNSTLVEIVVIYDIFLKKPAC